MKEIPDMRFQGKTVIITGSGQGIGRAFARSFAEEGATVVIADINEQTAATVVDEITDAGGSAEAAHLDIGSTKSIIECVDTVADQHGRIDALVNNAALFSSLKMQSMFDIDEDEWDLIFRINTKGTFLMAREVARVMKRQHHGKIINMSSGVVDNGRPNYLHYLSSKSALNGMTRGMATELGSFGINVNTVSPHGIATEVPRETISPEQWEAMVAEQPLHIQGNAESMVGAVLFLASDGADFVTGQTLHVNGGIVYN